MGGQVSAICRQICQRPNETGDALDLKPQAQTREIPPVSLGLESNQWPEALKIAGNAVEFLETAPAAERAATWRKCEAAWKLALDATK
eukprot:Skav201382  [mRNA]  locus=scaffold3514:223760:229909:+ [translate_table: standard]